MGNNCLSRAIGCTNIEGRSSRTRSGSITSSMLQSVALSELYCVLGKGESERMHRLRPSLSIDVDFRSGRCYLSRLFVESDCQNGSTGNQSIDREKNESIQVVSLSHSL